MSGRQVRSWRIVRARFIGPTLPPSRPFARPADADDVSFYRQPATLIVGIKDGE